MERKSGLEGDSCQAHEASPNHQDIGTPGSDCHEKQVSIDSGDAELDKFKSLIMHGRELNQGFFPSKLTSSICQRKDAVESTEETQDTDSTKICRRSDGKLEQID